MRLKANMPLPQFYMAPKGLLEMDIADGAKILYIFLFDRARLSQKNEKWQDENGDVFLYYTIDDLAKAIGKGKTSVKRYLDELEYYGLLNRFQKYVGAPNKIYVHLPDTEPVSGSPESEHGDHIRQSVQPENEPHGRPDTGRDEAQNRAASNNNIKIIKEKEQESNNVGIGTYKNIFLSADEERELRAHIENFDFIVHKASVWVHHGIMSGSGYECVRRQAAEDRAWK